MKRSIITLLINLLIVIVCSSQTTYPQILNDSLIVITPVQLKQTNLIFLEHSKLKLEQIETKKQLQLYDKLVNNYIRTDSIKSNQISLLLKNAEDSNNIINAQKNLIQKLNSKNRLYKTFTICGIGVSATLLILLLVK